MRIDLQAGSGGGGDVGVDYLFDVENAIGSAFHDEIEGDDGVNVLSGGAGNDVIEGRGGADVISGGTGNDTASYASATAAVVADLINEGANVGDAAGDSYSSIESLRGSAFADTLNGNSAGNTLDGGAGGDVMRGRAGDDSYFVDDAGDQVVEQAGEGEDTVIGKVSFALRDHSQHLENLALEGSANINGTGNGKANIIVGNAGDNFLNGAWGDDTLLGGGGDDTFSDEYGADRMEGGAGDDTYYVDNAGDAVVRACR